MTDLKEAWMTIRYPYRANEAEITEDLVTMFQPGWRWVISDVESTEITSFGEASPSWQTIVTVAVSR